MWPPCLAPQQKRGNLFTRNNCHRGLEIFCLSGPARQRFDLTFKNSSRTFHEVHVNFYGFCSPSFGLHIILLLQELTLMGPFPPKRKPSMRAAAVRSLVPVSGWVERAGRAGVGGRRASWMGGRIGWPTPAVWSCL